MDGHIFFFNKSLESAFRMGWQQRILYYGIRYMFLSEKKPPVAKTDSSAGFYWGHFVRLSDCDVAKTSPSKTQQMLNSSPHLAGLLKFFARNPSFQKTYHTFDRSQMVSQISSINKDIWICCGCLWYPRPPQDWEQPETTTMDVFFL